MNKIYRTNTNNKSKTYLLSEGDTKESNNQIDISKGQTISIVLNVLLKKENRVGNSIISALISYEDEIRVIDYIKLCGGILSEGDWLIGLESDNTNKCVSIFVEAEEGVQCTASPIHLSRI